MSEEREETRTVAQIVGQNMRRVREDWGKVLHDVATAAREIGLTWDASAVSRIETGKRELTLEEFLALPLVLTVALDRPVTMVDLLAVDSVEEIFVRSFSDQHASLMDVMFKLAEPLEEWVQVKGGATLKRGAVRELVRGRLDQEKRDVYLARAAEEEPQRVDQFYATAQELGVHPADVMDAMKALGESGRWHQHTLFVSEEREKRLIESGEDLSNPTRVRTLRGHITRQLMAELREYFAEHPGRKISGIKVVADESETKET